MEGQKRANWADESDEEWSDHEEVSAPQPKPQTTAYDNKRETLIAKIKSSSFPLVLTLNNLSYNLREASLKKELGVSESSTITFIKENEKFTGSATITLAGLADALLVAEKSNTDVAGRALFVNFYSNDRSYRGDRGGDRGARRGGRGGRGARRGGEYGRQNYNDKQYYEEKSYQRKPESRGGNPESKPLKVEPKPVGSEVHNRITIAPSENSQPQPIESKPNPPKPRSNPFGDAKPVDTLNKELEFEKRLVSAPKPQPEEPEVKKEVEKKYQEKEVVEEKPEKAEPEVIVNVIEIKEEEEVTERGGYRGRRGGRGYRRKYTDDAGESSPRYDDRRNYDGKRRYNQGKFYTQDRKASEGDRAEQTWNKPEKNNEEGSKVEPDSVEQTEFKKPQEYKRPYSGKQRPYEGGRNYENQRNYQDGGRYKQKYDSGRNYDEGVKNEGYKKNTYGKKNEGQPEAPKTKAWGDPNQAAEILKKPKESFIREEDKITKSGNHYVKKSYQNSP